MQGNARKIVKLMKLEEERGRTKNVRSILDDKKIIINNVENAFLTMNRYRERQMKEPLK